MSHLGPVFERFGRRLDYLEGIFVEWAGLTPSPLLDKDIMFLEGLVSTLWQHWSLFCRRVVFSSAMGCVTRSGIAVAPSVSPIQWERVSYIALRVRARASVRPALINSDLWREPTWGDVKRVQDIVTAMSLNNAPHIVSCLGSASRGPLDVQLVRNAAAHRNLQTLAAVKGLNIFYNATRIRHPVEVATWTDPASGDFAFIAWIDEMRILGDLMTN